MKINKTKTAFSLLAVALISGDARAESASDIGTLPSQRIPATVNEGDRNPFATRIAISEESVGEFNGDSEESRIRQVFSRLNVTGRVPGNGGSPRVLVGDLILAEGELVPQVIENQTDVLRVTRITDKEVELTWVDEEATAAPRRLPIPIDLSAKVDFILPGRGSNGGQFVTMGNPGDAPSASDVAQAIKIIEGISKQNSAAPLEAEEEGFADDPEDSATQQKQKRVSPFGLFRR